MGIQAATGCSPDKLTEDPKTGELIWQDRAVISPELQAILTKMTRYDFQKRYQSASEVLQGLYGLLQRYSMTVAGMQREHDDLELDITSEAWDGDSSANSEEMTLPWQASADTE